MNTMWLVASHFPRVKISHFIERQWFPFFIVSFCCQIQSIYHNGFVQFIQILTNNDIQLQYTHICVRAILFSHKRMLTYVPHGSSLQVINFFPLNLNENE